MSVILSFGSPEPLLVLRLYFWVSSCEIYSQISAKFIFISSLQSDDDDPMDEFFSRLTDADYQILDQGRYVKVF